ncbi:MAG: aldo/keto reductase [Eubacteriales bacterium]
MQYRNAKNNDPISLLGYGCMRFTKNGSTIDLEKAEQEILSAISQGVNYFDTAYIYPGSEVALGSILTNNHLREQVKIATKLPQYLIKSATSIERYFQEQLNRLQTDYIDFYLMHMITDIASWNKLIKLGILEWIQEKKASGQIKQLGFSYHGNTEMFLQILEAYDWDFCQIQYNYMDEHSQAGRKGLERAYALHIPVIIMEPLRGGRLATYLPSTAQQLIENHPRGYSAAEWSFRWIMEQHGVMTVLSGMNSLAMVEENVRIASQVAFNEFTQEDHQLITDVKTAIQQLVKVNCTGCGYCLPCVKHVDIPGVFRCYNTIYADGKRKALREYIQTTLLRKESSSASHCIRCGKCVPHCPQGIDIPQELKAASKHLDTFYMRIIRIGIRIFKVW